MRALKIQPGGGVKSPLKERLKKPLSMICFCVLFSISSLFIVALAYMQSCCNDHLQEDRHGVQSQMSKIAMRKQRHKRQKNTGEQEKVARMKDYSTSEHFSCLTFRTLSVLNALYQSSHTVGTVTRMNLWFMILLNSVVVVTHPCSLYHVANETGAFRRLNKQFFRRKETYSRYFQQVVFTACRFLILRQFMYIELVNELFSMGIP